MVTKVPKIGWLLYQFGAVCNLERFPQPYATNSAIVHT
jgi:hypothetical protein